MSSLPAIVCFIIAGTIVANLILAPIMLNIQESSTLTITINPLGGFLATLLQMALVMVLTCAVLHRNVTEWLRTARAWLWLVGTAVMVRIAISGLFAMVRLLQEPPAWVTMVHQVAVQVLLLLAFVLLTSKLLGFGWSNRCLGYAACFVALPLLQQFLSWSFTRHYLAPQRTPTSGFNLFFLQGMLVFWLDEWTVYFWIHILGTVLPLLICYTMARRPSPTVAPFLLTHSQAKGRRQLHSWLAVWGGLYLTTQIFMTTAFGSLSLDTWCFWVGLGLLLAADFRQVCGRWTAATAMSSMWWGFWLFVESSSLSDAQSLLEMLPICIGSVQSIVAIILCILMGTQEGDLGDYRFYLSESPPSLQRRWLSAVGQGLFWSGLIFMVTTIVLVLISGESIYWLF